MEVLVLQSRILASGPNCLSITFFCSSKGINLGLCQAFPENGMNSRNRTEIGRSRTKSTKSHSSSSLNPFITTTFNWGIVNLLDTPCEGAVSNKPAMLIYHGKKLFRRAKREREGWWWKVKGWEVLPCWTKQGKWYCGGTFIELIWELITSSILRITFPYVPTAEEIY